MHKKFKTPHEQIDHICLKNFRIWYGQLDKDQFIRHQNELIAELKECFDYFFKKYKGK